MISTERLYVIKRDGSQQNCLFDKITTRLARLCNNIQPPLNEIDPAAITQKISNQIFPGVTTSQLDELAAETAAYLSTENPEWDDLAARIAISNLQKETLGSFESTMRQLYGHRHPHTGLHCPLISPNLWGLITQEKKVKRIEEKIDYDRDFLLNFFGFRTLFRNYLLKINGRVVERPQHMWMRVSLGIHGDDLEAAFETYDMMSLKRATHATPTLYNAGTPSPQLSSCFLLDMEDDSILGIYDTLKQCAQISKYAGGIGFTASKIRATRSFIAGTGGNANGLVPMLRVFNDTARYVDQGGGKRKGSFCCYLEPWHADVEDWLLLRRNNGKEEQRARDLNFALWIPDLFMKRVEEGGTWSLFCPNEAPNLWTSWGVDFEDLYKQYEQRPGLARKTMPAQELWFQILDSQMETGQPFMVYKDACNRKSNQQNVGMILSSNLCTEIVEVSHPGKIAVCNLASISLPSCVQEGTFDMEKLKEITRILVRNLNKIIDGNFYPLKECATSNMSERPIGIGVQGLADAFQMMSIVPISI